MVPRPALVVIAALVGASLGSLGSACGGLSHPPPLDDQVGAPGPGNQPHDAGKDVGTDAPDADAAATDAAADAPDIDAAVDGGDKLYGNSTCVHCIETGCPTEWAACKADPMCSLYYGCYYGCPCGGPDGGTCPTAPTCSNCDSMATSTAYFTYANCAAGKFKSCGCN